MIIGRPIQNYDAVEIGISPAAVFEYVTRPDLWHEWHPASTSAVLPRVPLRAGDAFHEMITISYPFMRIRRATDYTVTVSEPNSVWEVRGKSTLFDLVIHYEFKPQGETTLFERTLTYQVKGLLAYFEPILVRPKIRGQSALALRNLKKLLESRNGRI
ncbi:MAG: SRPBCC family protein [Spirochaetes bacterium]|nr:SRPBCC family protein [Spirochaetota bacterium]